MAPNNLRRHALVAAFLFVAGCGDDPPAKHARPPVVTTKALRLVGSPSAKKLAAFYCPEVGGEEACDRALGAAPAAADLHTFVEVELEVANEGDLPFHLDGALVEAAVYPDDEDRRGSGRACADFCLPDDPGCQAGFDPASCPASRDEADQLLDRAAAAVVGGAAGAVTTVVELNVSLAACVLTLGLVCEPPDPLEPVPLVVPEGESRFVRVVIVFDGDGMSAVLRKEGLKLATNELSGGLLGSIGALELKVPASVRGLLWYRPEEDAEPIAVDFGPSAKKLTF